MMGIALNNPAQIQHYTALFAALPTPSVLIDDRGLILDFNDPFAAYFPQLHVSNDPQRDWIGRPLRELVVGDAGFDQFIDGLVRTAQATQANWRLRPEVGRSQGLDIQGIPLRDEQDRPLGAILLVGVAAAETNEVHRRTIVEAIREAVWAMEGSEDIEHILFLIYDSLHTVEFPDFHACSVNLVGFGTNPADFQRYMVNHSGQWTESFAPVEERVPLTRIWQDQQVVYRADLLEQDDLNEAESLAEEYGASVRSVVDVPFSCGTLAVNSTRVAAFSPESIAFLQDLAGVLDEGFRRLRDLQNMARQAELAGALAEAIAVVADSRNLHTVLQAVVEQAARLTESERAALFLYEKEAGVLVPRAQVGHADEFYKQIRLNPGEGMSGRVFASGEPYMTSDNRTDETASWQGETQRLFVAAYAGSLGGGAAVPLRLHERVIGTLALGSGQRHYSAEDMDLLARLGEQAVLAIDRIEQMEQLELQGKQLLQSQKMEVVGRLAGGMAHDFNNVLTAILVTSDQMLRSASPYDPRRADLELIRDASEQAAGLIHQLLAFSRRQVLELKVIDLNEMLQGFAHMATRLIGEDIELVTVYDPDLGGAEFDPGQFEQVILNLMINARDAMAGGGKITIETGNVELGEESARHREDLEPGPHVFLAVSDQGQGMDAETCEQIFEPFFTTKEQGTGLGLATVYGIVRQSGGHIFVDSELDVGTTFTIYLPRVAKEPTGEKPATVAALARGSETILMVDDDKLIRATVDKVLSAAGYRLLVATGPESALELSAGYDQAIDLLLTDVIMPRMNGGQLAERIQAQRADIKVLYMSGYTDNVIASRHILGPGINFIQKPFTGETLALKVRQVLDE